MLDELTTAGEVVWAGAGALPGKDGWVSLYLADAAPLLLPPPHPLELTALHESVLTTLSGGYGLFFRQIADQVRATTHPDATDPQLADAVWDLAWSGRLTNDTLAPMRSLLGSGRTAGSTAHRAKRTVPRGRYGSLTAAARPASRTGPPTVAGRWSLLPRREPDPTVRAHALARTLLDRHGVVTRGAVAAGGRRGRLLGRRTASCPPSRTAARPAAAMWWRASAPPSSRWTARWTGSARWPTPETGRRPPERLRLRPAPLPPNLRSPTARTDPCHRAPDRDDCPAEATQPVRLHPGRPTTSPPSDRTPRANDSALRPNGRPAYGPFAAVDPTAPAPPPTPEPSSSPPPTPPTRTAPRCPGPSRPTGAGHKPGRKAGSLVVLVDGELTLYMERGGKTLLAWPSDPDGQPTDDPRLRAAAEALAAAARAGSLGTVTVERVNGASALTSPIGPLLEAAGFLATPRGLRLTRMNPPEPQPDPHPAPRTRATSSRNAHRINDPTPPPAQPHIRHPRPPRPRMPPLTHARRRHGLAGREATAHAPSPGRC